MRTRVLVPAVLSVTAAALVGCSSNSATTPATTSPAAPSAAAATTVMVDEHEFVIKLDKTTFKPGVYTFEVMNMGHAPHDLVINGPGIDHHKTSTLSAGNTENLTVTLQKGTYELWCTVADHKADGMDTTITVD